jgi:hypothetical protein
MPLLGTTKYTKYTKGLPARLAAGAPKEFLSTNHTNHANGGVASRSEITSKSTGLRPVLSSLWRFDRRTRPFVWFVWFVDN